MERRRSEAGAMKRKLNRRRRKYERESIAGAGSRGAHAREGGAIPQLASVDGGPRPVSSSGIRHLHASQMTPPSGRRTSPTRPTPRSASARYTTRSARSPAAPRPSSGAPVRGGHTARLLLDKSVASADGGKTEEGRRGSWSLDADIAEMATPE
eukprot:962092-Prorocentrum_minimum.AAC.1